MVTIVGIAADQATKAWIRVDEAVNSPGGIPVIPHFFSIVHAENPGAAFGMLGDLSQGWRLALFIGFAGVATYLVWDTYRRLNGNQWFVAGVLGLILSGAYGNIFDRVYRAILGEPATVTDWLSFYTDDPGWVEWLESMVGMHQYPAFNIADANLLVGVVLFLVHYLFFESRRGAEDDEDDGDAPVEPEEVVDATYAADADDEPTGEAAG